MGTPSWMAPEVLEGSPYGPSADIWSLGITLLELAHGHAPFAKLPPLKARLAAPRRGAFALLRPRAPPSCDGRRPKPMDSTARF